MTTQTNLGIDAPIVAPKDPRKRWTEAQLERLREHIVDCLAELSPRTARNIFYTVTDPRLDCPVSKDQAGYDRVLRLLSDMRFSGRVDWSAVVDNSRNCEYHGGGTREFSLSQSLRFSYWRRDFYHDAPWAIQIWMESDSLMSVLGDSARRWRVDMWSCKGFSSHSHIRKGAREMYSFVRRTDKTPIILYLGDYDPSGLTIPESLLSEYTWHLNAAAKEPGYYGGDGKEREVDFRRIAINLDQVAQYQIPSKPRKESQKIKPDILDTYECEALRPDILEGIIRAELESITGLAFVDERWQEERAVNNQVNELESKFDRLSFERLVELVEEAAGE